MIGRTVIAGPGGGWVARFGKDDEPSDADLSLMLAAPTMYRIIRQICHTDWRCREQGLRSAQFFLQELEGGPDAET
jgi:hypothetical protein